MHVIKLLEDSSIFHVCQHTLTFNSVAHELFETASYFYMMVRENNSQNFNDLQKKIQNFNYLQKLNCTNKTSP